VVIAEPGATRAVATDGEAWVVPECRTRCTVRYVVDLETLAASCGRMDCERQIDGAMIGAASAVMLLPQPAGNATVRVRLSGESQDRFATGLRRDPSGGFILDAQELLEASYTAFGTFRHARVPIPGAALDVALLGAPLAMGDGATLDWIHDGASCVARLFGRFPVDATLFVVPVPGENGVVFGRVMSLSGASVVLFFGDETTTDRKPSDWVVVHELFHLGCPSFVGEGHWLEEGLATYYEPILRARAGWITSAGLWGHFRAEFSRGLRKAGEPPNLEDRDDIDSTYWGGALFAFLADVGIRQATHGERSLDDALRAVLAREGDATHAARVADFVRTGDAATGTNVLANLYASWAVKGENADLDVLWRQLGVGPDEAGQGFALHDDAPLAGIRRAITVGDGH
jgi:predicted metalloprotease with PDZ domain